MKLSLKTNDVTEKYITNLFVNDCGLKKLSTIYEFSINTDWINLWVIHKLAIQQN